MTGVTLQLSPLIAELLRRRGLDADAVTSRADIAGNTPGPALMNLAADEGQSAVALAVLNRSYSAWAGT